MQMKTHSGHLFVRGKKMNKKQTVCLCLGIIVFVLMGLFPPCTLLSPIGDYVKYGYKFIWNQFKGRYYGDARDDLLWESRIDASRLFVQWAAVAVITAGLIYTFKGRPKDKEKERTGTR